ncbi:metallophosphoesterase family protein [Planomicrobium okeanokoites]|uniref:metallophosphoesterase family protein n=1 Tax=Planomicrobium okeanokoites TaxID=244 RepID=UPI000A013BB6|nr:metallophosphoesterase [Planomicrobium okeanokoites]
MKIAVIGDLHYPTVKEEYALSQRERQDFYESFMAHFFSVPADLYVSIGDLTNFGTQDELEGIYAIIDQHQKPFVHVLGNHDVYAMPREEVLKITKQDRFHSLSTDSAVLAFLDTAQEQNYEDWGGTLDLEQQFWLADVVADSGNRPLLVFGHHPVYGTTKNSSKEKRFISPDIPMWDLLNNKQNAGLYVNGHNHFNSIAAREQWTFLQIAAVLDEQAVRVIDISEAMISIDYVPFVDPNLRQQARNIGNAIDHFSLNTHRLGTEADVKYAIPLAAPTIKTT